MHADLVDRYQEGRSLIHRLDPRVKLGVAVLYILSCALLPDGAWPAYGLSLGLLLVWDLLAGLGWGYTLKRSFVALPFALAAFTVMFSLPGEPLTSFSLGPWRLTVSDAGLLRFLSILARSWLSVQAAILLTATTQFPDLAHAMRHLRVPDVLISIISFMYRYLFVLGDEALRLLRGRAARSAQLPGKGGGSLPWRAGVAGGMVGQLFLRSYERSERVYDAMLARGYRGRFLTLNPHALRGADWAAFGLAAAALLALQFLARLHIL